MHYSSAFVSIGFILSVLYSPFIAGLYRCVIYNLLTTNCWRC